ncbi:MAG: hydrogenase [Candidatus Makaraimicrobium thalassicum]|nr:MAG: hydrogenase [Candidatus Omnitrophota bacterium]
MIGLTLRTGAGFWNPVILSFSLIVVICLVYFVRSFGEKKYKKGTEQTDPFFSGAPAPQKVGGGNIYGIFFTYMDEYYVLLKRMHTGVINDYVYWFVLTLTIVLVVLALGGLP